jgi:hypothetical protein
MMDQCKRKYLVTESFLLYFFFFNDTLSQCKQHKDKQAHSLVWSAQCLDIRNKVMEVGTCK